MASKIFKLILAIETSCDETAAAVLEINLERQPAVFSPTRRSASGSSLSLTMPRARNKSVALGAFFLPKITTLSSITKSQIKLHSKMGGVVPEAAARAHVKNILPVVRAAIAVSGKRLETIDYIAVTQGPGLIPSLIVGVEFAKALSLATGKPLIPVNHMAGHLYSPFGKLSADSRQQTATLFPLISLIVSGGHTMIVLMKDIKSYKVLGETVDDAAGEAFDKVAKLLGLPYPGGPEVSKMATQAKHPVEFPRPMIHTKDYNFSFSGLKTAVLYYLRDHQGASKADICAGFQNAAVDVLVTKTIRAAKQYKARSVSLSGGVAANQMLRSKLADSCQLSGVSFHLPPLNLCTDNAEMIGIAAAFKILYNSKAVISPLKLQANPNLNL